MRIAVVKLALVLCVLVPALNADAQFLFRMLANQPAITNAAGGGGGSPSYLVQQGFEAAGYDNSESWTEVGTGTIDEDYTGVVLDGSESLRLALTAQTGSTRTSFAGQADVWGYFMVRVISLPDADSQLFMFLDAGNSEVARVRLLTTGALDVRAGSGTPGGTIGTMSAGTTYFVRVRYTKGTGANAFASVEFTETTFSGGGSNYAQHPTGGATADCAGARFGTTTSATYEIVFDKGRVDDAIIGDNPE